MAEYRPYGLAPDEVRSSVFAPPQTCLHTLPNLPSFSGVAQRRPENPASPRMKLGQAAHAR